MNKIIQDMIKFWGYLRKLLKPDGEGFLLSKKQPILLGYPIAKIALINNVAQATNVVFGNQYSLGEGSLIVGGKVIPDSGLDCHSLVLSLPIQERKNNEITEKYQRISKPSASGYALRWQEEPTKEPRNGNRLVIKYRANGNESAMNKQTKTRADRSSSIM